MTKKNMTNKIKLALLATTVGLTLTSSQAATYTGDLIVGFTTQTGNDLVYDLGAQSALTNGSSWNLSALLAGYNLDLVNWGVIGDKNVSGIRTAWITTDGIVPSAVPNLNTWGNLDNATGTIIQNMPSGGAGQSVLIDSAAANSWNKETLDGLGSFTSYQSFKGNTPNVVGKTSATFFSMIANGSTPVNIGTFTLSGSGTLTFNVVSANPPAPQIVAITRTNTTSYISFTTTNGSFTYKLYFTNSAGLTAAVSNWPSSATTVIGNGLTNTLQNISTDANQFYRIGVK